MGLTSKKPHSGWGSGARGRWEGNASPPVPHACAVRDPRAVARRQRPAVECPGADLRPAADNIDQVAFATLCLINNERAAEGLPALKEQAQLTQASTAYSQLMVDQHFFAHVSPSGVALTRGFRPAATSTQPGAWTIGENIAWGESFLASPTNIVKAWMDSPPHRENILSNDFARSASGSSAASRRASTPARPTRRTSGAARRRPLTVRPRRSSPTTRLGQRARGNPRRQAPEHTRPRAPRGTQAPRSARPKGRKAHQAGSRRPLDARDPRDRRGLRRARAARRPARAARRANGAAKRIYDPFRPPYGDGHCVRGFEGPHPPVRRGHLRDAPGEEARRRGISRMQPSSTDPLAEGRGRSVRRAADRRSSSQSALSALAAPGARSRGTGT